MRRLVAALYRVVADPLMWALHPSPDRYQEPVFRAFFEQRMTIALRAISMGVLRGPSASKQTEPR